MQKPYPKNVPQVASFQKQASELSEQALKFLFGLSAKFGRSGEVAQNNYQLGIKHLASGNFSDAVFRFKAVTWLEPANAEAWYNLATSYLATKNPSLAVKAYRQTLALKPDYEEAAYMLAVALGKKVTPQEMPRKMPLTLVTSHFEGLAQDYNRQQVEQGQYKGHIKLVEAVRAVLQSGRLDHVVLDLGCGTGLCGAQLRNIASEITGVDISPKMLIEAMQLKDTNNRKVYDELIDREASEFLKDAYGDFYDVILAGVTFSFIGDVSAIFTQAARTLKAGGILAFTADKADGKDYIFDPAGGRFRFSKDYFQKLASANGFKELRFDEIEAYPGYNMWLVILKK